MPTPRLNKKPNKSQTGMSGADLQQFTNVSEKLSGAIEQLSEAINNLAIAITNFTIKINNTN